MKKIVIIDDDSEIRASTEAALTYAGYRVFTATDGNAGLELIRKVRPNVVLLDLIMPGIHGFAVCQELRSDPSMSELKIIVTSEKAYPSDIKKTRELGANGYIVKPYRPDEVLVKVREALDPAGPPLEVRFWGTRGSIPTPGSATLRYGGNTACVEVRSGEDILMFDCGTGAREMGLSLMREFGRRAMELHIFISHTHWDHIQGFPFFAPAYVPGNRIILYNKRAADKSLEKVFTGQMDSSYFPVSLGDMLARTNFVELDGIVKIGSMSISHMFLNHPGIALGFRIQLGPKSVVYITDHEPYVRMLGDREHNRKLDREVTEFARDADLYIREAQYTVDEYTTKRGWGHSTFRDALESAQIANAKQLAFFHHDPEHDDETIDRILADCREEMRRCGMKFACFAAADNLRIKI